MTANPTPWDASMPLRAEWVFAESCYHRRINWLMDHTSATWAQAEARASIERQDAVYAEAERRYHEVCKQYSVVPRIPFAWELANLRTELSDVRVRENQLVTLRLPEGYELMNMTLPTGVVVEMLMANGRLSCLTPLEQSLIETSRAAQTPEITEAMVERAARAICDATVGHLPDRSREHIWENESNQGGYKAQARAGLTAALHGEGR